MCIKKWFVSTQTTAKKKYFFFFVAHSKKKLSLPQTIILITFYEKATLFFTYLALGNKL